MSARITVKSLAEQFAAEQAVNAAFREEVRAYMAAVSPASPAKVTQPKAAPKARKPRKAAKPATKGAQTRETLSRKDWNRTLTAKARFYGGDTYKTVLADWADVQALREQGFTPDQVLASYVK